MTMRVSLCAALYFMVCIAWADEFAEKRMQNWHQFRGPEATGVAPLGDPPTEWSETKNIRWKVAIPGRGSASPIVWDDRIYILSAVKTDRTEEKDETADGRVGPRAQLVSQEQAAQPPAQQGERRRERGEGEGEGRGRGEFGRGGRGDFGRGGFGGGFGRGFGRGFGGGKPTNVHQFVVMCIDRKTGETIWQKTANEMIPHEGHHQTGSFASASPFTDGKHLWASFGSRGVYCYDLDGNKLWDKDLGDMQVRMAFGEGSSPVVYGDTLVHQWDHDGDSFIVALDARTGDEKWRVPRDESSTWATPLIVEAAGHTQVITCGSNRVRSYDLKNGDVIWECAGLGSNPIACPVTIDGLAIVMSGHRDPAGLAVPLTAKGDVTDSDIVAWKIDEITPYVSSPLLYDGVLWFTKSRNAILSAIDARTGETIIKQKRLPGMDSIYASPVGAAGKVYFFSREGVTNVMRQGREFEVLATNQLDEVIDASPAIVGKELILRGENHLYCIAED